MKSPASCQAAQHSFYVRYEQGETAFQHCVSWSWVNSIVPAVFTHGKLIGRWRWAALCALTAFLFNAINRISQVVTVPAERNGFHLGCSVGRVLNAFSSARCIKPMEKKEGPFCLAQVVSMEGAFLCCPECCLHVWCL